MRADSLHMVKVFSSGGDVDLVLRSTDCVPPHCQGEMAAIL